MPEPEPIPEPEPEPVEEEEVPEFEPEVLQGSAAVASLLKKAKAPPSPVKPEPIEDDGMEHDVARPYDFFDAIEAKGEEHPVQTVKRKEGGA